MQETLKQDSKIKKIFKGYLEILQFLFSSKPIKYFLSAPISENSMIIILGLMGMVRAVLEHHILLPEFHFPLNPDMVLMMFFYLIYLCFFSTAVLYFVSNKLDLKVKIKEILSVLFFIQVVHVIILFIDNFLYLCNDISSLDTRCIPTFFDSTYIEQSRYLKLIFSPLVFTPIILFYTTAISISYVIAWLFGGFILFKLYVKHFKFPVIKTLIVLSITFYILYISIYSSYYFLVGPGHVDFLIYSLFLMFLLIPSIIYVKVVKKREENI